MKDPKIELLYGIHTVLSLLQRQPERLLELFCVDSRHDARVQAIITLAKEQGLSVQKVPQKQLDQWLPDTNHQGIVARCKIQKPLSEHDLDEILATCQGAPLFLVLEGVQDPHNLGACLRTCDAVGVTAIIIPQDRAASVTPVVRKVSCGASETVPIIQVGNLVRALETLKQKGVWVMGTTGDAPESLYQSDLKGPLAIVLGAEGTGLRRLTLEHCDLLMHIPMHGMVESLNVSVAAAVCLYEALRQRATSSFHHTSPLQ
jgi:23S rRNA (guanosine2251-2'-O)-methyltransferase